jgi:hypothetical protein
VPLRVGGGARVVRAAPQVSGQRSVRNAARSSVVNSAGSCQAAKWQPRSTSLK